MSLRGLLALVLAAVVVAVLAATSRADFDDGTANGIRYIRDSSTLTPPGQPAAVSAECPPATHLIGAGANASDAGEVGILSSLRPEDDDDKNALPDDGVAAFAHNNTGVGGFTHAYAFCAAGKVRYPSRTTTLSLGDTRAIKVPCPSGTKVLSGGVFLDGLNSDVRLNALHPFDDDDDNARPDDGWKVKVSNLAGADKLYMAWAFCRADVKPVYLEQAETVDSGDVDFASMSCPNQARSVAGIGGEISGSPDARGINGLEPADDTSQGEADTVPDDRGFIEVFNPTAGQAPFTLHLVCAEL